MALRSEARIIEGGLSISSVMGIAYVGASLHGILFAALVAICAFDGGRLAADWTDCLVPLGLLLIPLLLAVVGIARRSSPYLVAATAAGAVVGLVSFLGPGLFVLVPVILYGVSAGRETPRNSIPAEQR